MIGIKVKSVIGKVIATNYFKLFKWANVFLVIVGTLAKLYLDNVGAYENILGEFMGICFRIASIFIIGWGLINAIISKYNEDYKMLVVSIFQMIHGILTPFLVPLWFFFFPAMLVLTLIAELIGF